MQKQIYLFSTSSHPQAISVKSLDIDFFKPTINFSKYDYLILTSKQTIKALKQYEIDDFLDIPALCVSEKTASEYESLGGKILQVGGGYGDDLAITIQTLPTNTQWLYLRASVVASDFAQKMRELGYKIDEKIIYESRCSKEILDINIKENSVLIFTSPSAVRCFLEVSEISLNLKVIAIGKTTAKELPKSIKYFIPNKTSIDACIELALRLYCDKC